MLSRIRYWLLNLQHSKHADYIDMGFGIEARYHRCRPFWQEHIKNCKQLQRNSLKDFKAKSSIAVFGAGRCYDVDMSYFLEQDFSVDLFDADPGCLRTWKQYGKGVNRYLGDLTNSIDMWSNKLESFFFDRPSVDEEAFCELFKSLECGKYELPKVYDAILSINLLSQIPIYWRDRVAKFLAKHWKLAADEYGNFCDEIQDAIEYSMKKLQAQHLALLEESQAKTIMLIYDDAFFYYESTNPLWQKEKALYVDVNLNAYQSLASYQWLWDIAPQGVEQDDYGAVHSVVGQVFNYAKLRS